jgi:hypothetical protein
MGQYFKPGVIELNECVCSHDFDNGLKLMEHSWIGNNFVNVVEKLIAKDGAWFGKPLTWGGDYAEEGDVNPDTYGFNKIVPEVTEKHYFRFLINETKKSFVDLDKVPITDTWVNPDDATDTYDYRIHPLPLLTCNSNGRGGGDFHGDDANDLIGSWAGEVITVSDDQPSNEYTELIFDLVE